jgi:ribosomal protein S18 acetylase RimI-like enzyme
MPSITLRPLTLDDHDAILALWQRAGLGSRLQGRDSRKAFAEQLAGGAFVLGLQDGGKLVACAIVTDDTRKGWINRLAVDPDYRRQGLAAQLIEEAEHALRDKGIHVFAALIHNDNVPSLSLFQHEGYKPLDIVVVTKRDYEDA